MALFINTGWKNGVIHRIENHVGRPLQSICVLHFDELPFRHIFQHIDGRTAPDSNFSLQQSCSNLALQICNKFDTTRVQAETSLRKRLSHHASNLWRQPHCKL
ncbi:hypothetical protein AVEN_53379-1 [Araneus ventricosus]|uniref:Uncharacterized protein n=1 Tax=Araneus ventricosus TaxID=182803 RepID=A0A4Y2A9Y5_ARAVE|nr:hypothetical protein AVEN_53379-1 [Araneus ventricosus]